jgi:polysaccharide pyruvyl transferase WcaK-like protein
LHDAITAEKAGVPAVGIMTAAFVDTAHALAQACGMPGYPFALIAHPIAPDGDEALRRKAAEAVHQCQELLLRR